MLSDIEFKPDLVWPFSCKITATAISDDTNNIAVGLEDGNVVIWDRYMGKVLNGEDTLHSNHLVKTVFGCLVNDGLLQKKKIIIK